ncbi:GEVED domain-containing protein [Bizionia arctica]|uniref:LTD domain-containing protein n=1 Tax=Bizionia arctica TaxID=1495645 RepID=A0A917GCK6_9FLAO|nr:GEVED domain-containing protein [Bizionia arctica]GGG38265.1 hypothetical protein GCM10010976_07490 [Bizionia arctica]
MIKNYSLVLVAFLCFVLSGYGQTTVTYSFLASGAVTGLDENSPGISLDANIGFGSFKNSASTNPGIFSNQLRLYQNATKGGSIIIYASNGVTITKVVVNASGTTGPAGYEVDGAFVANLTASTTYTMSGLSATSDVEFYQRDGSSSNRIYISSFEVTYTSVPTTSPPTITSALTASGIVSGAFTYDIVATNTPTSYGATGLPAGLSINTTTGEISGTPTAAGTFNVTITATNAYGADTETLVISLTTGPCYTGHAPNFTKSGSTYGGDTDSGGSPTTTIRLASGSNSGTVSTTATGVSSGNVTLKFRAKGWSASERKLRVTLDGQIQNITDLPYSDFEWVELTFTGVAANPSLSFFADEDERVHLGNVEIYCTPSTPCTGTPTPGNTVSSETSVVSGGTTNLSLQNTTTGSGATYQWQSSTTSAVAGFSDIIGATNATYTATVNAITWYRCVVTCSGNSGTSIAVEVGVTYASPNNATQLKACIANTQVSLSWTASSGTTPTGYIVFAQPNTTIPQMAATSAGNASSYTANANYSAATTYTTLGKAVYKGAGTTATVTGLTNASQYTFKVVAYNGETGTGWANAINNNSVASSYTQTYTIDVPEVSNLAASINPTTSTVSWNVVPDSAGCYEYMVVANAGAVSLTPTGNGSAYAANPVYAGANQVVYKGTGSSIIVTGLTDAVEYCYTVFVREVNIGTQWSGGISVCQTTGVDYCDSAGDVADTTGITSVVFNTINQTSTGESAYTDYTSVSTTVLLNNIYTLSVNVNTVGYQNYTKAWIDWNRDGDFSDSGEEYDLGDAYSGTNILTSNSPLSITVPTNATIGNTRMRVATQYFFDDSDIALTPCATYDYGEVEDYTINVVQPVNAEINVKGGAISIPNGFDAPYGLNNTLFASTEVNTDSAEKEFTIENIGLANLILIGTPIIKLEGTNPTDFIVTQQATTPVVNGTNVTFKIKFHPTVAGTRTAKVRIESNDSDENPYLFTIEGNGDCLTDPTVTTFPTSGPANTLVTFTSATSNLTGATITYNNIAVATVSNTSDTIEVLLPAEANDGNFVIQLATGCSATQFFDVIDIDLTACDTAVGGADASNLIIYEVYDENGGSGGVITIYNNTGASVDLGGYKIERAGDYGGSYVTYANLNGTIASGAVAIVSVTSSACGYTPTGNGSLGNAGFNANDGLRLMNGTTLIDDVEAPNYVGYYLKRKNTNFYPNTTYDASEWTAQSLADDECLVGVGSVPLVKLPPTVISNPQYVADCSNLGTSLTVAGSEGVSGGLALAYQWYVLGPSGNWTAVSNGGIYSGATTATLDIANLTGLDDYQFYCQVRENSATCYTASEATKIELKITTWDGTAWSNGAPDQYTITNIDGDYTTNSTNGSFTACQLLVTSGSLLTIAQGYFVEVINNVEITGNGTDNDGILVEDKGSFVQRGDGLTAGSFTLNTNGFSKFNKRTAPLNNYYEYTYWSSPTIDETVGGGLEEAHPTRRYWYNAENYLDKTAEANNNNGTVNGQDDIDDNGDDWQATDNGDLMIPGVGYAAMHDPIGFDIAGAGGQFEYIFEGAFNTGDIDVPIYRNDSEMSDNNWNLIGNPYPSAVDAQSFLDANTLIAQDVSGFPTGTTNGAIFFWSQSTAPSDTANGNENLNFAQSDYAIINATGQTAGGDNNNDGTINASDRPNRFIPSGQAFFISYSDVATPDSTNGDIKTGTVSFTNSMRVTGDNDQFFRNSSSTQVNRLWVNMWSDNGVRNQILVGYVEGATNTYDGMYYDAPKNLSSEVNAMIYTVADNSDKKLAIQGKAVNSLNLDEVIPLGFYSLIPEATLYSISTDSEGLFFEENTVYLKDMLMNVIHDLSANDYSFTSETGEFNNRFEIVFRDSFLSIHEEELNANNVTIIEHQNGEVQFTVPSPYEIKHIEIIDLLGRPIYKLKGTSYSETYDLSNLSQATYLAKITLSNGQTITKKAVKRH